jgi:hypothetical protein
VRQGAIALLLMLAGAAVAHLHVAMQTYAPVIRIATPEGLVYTAWFDPRDERRACADASKLFVDPIKARCAECEVIFARCERELQDFEHLMAEEPGGHHVVSLPGLRIDIAGPAASARRSCHVMADDFTKHGVQSAICEHQMLSRL